VAVARIGRRLVAIVREARVGPRARIYLEVSRAAVGMSRSLGMEPGVLGVVLRPPEQEPGAQGDTRGPRRWSERVNVPVRTVGVIVLVVRQVRHGRDEELDDEQRQPAGGEPGAAAETDQQTVSSRHESVCLLTGHLSGVKPNLRDGVPNGVG
jgi:hypothetical protein